MHACMQTYRHTDVQTYRQTYRQTYTHTRIHTCIHTYITLPHMTLPHICHYTHRFSAFHLDETPSLSHLAEAGAIWSLFLRILSLPQECWKARAE